MFSRAPSSTFFASVAKGGESSASFWAPPAHPRRSPGNGAPWWAAGRQARAEATTRDVPAARIVAELSRLSA